MKTKSTNLLQTKQQQRMGRSRVGRTIRDFQAAVCQLEEAISKQQLDWRKEERGEILKGLGEEKSRIKKLYMRQKQP
jgi:hypothetical protein